MISNFTALLMADTGFPDGMIVEPIVLTKRILPRMIISLRGDEPTRFGTRSEGLNTVDMMFKGYAEDYTGGAELMYNRLIELFSFFRGDLGNLRIQTSQILTSNQSYEEDGKTFKAYTATVEVEFKYTILDKTKVSGVK